MLQLFCKDYDFNNLFLLYLIFTGEAMPYLPPLMARPCLCYVIKETTDAMFALRMLMEKYREGQRELYCLFVDLEKAYDRVPREKL